MSSSTPYRPGLLAALIAAELGKSGQQSAAGGFPKANALTDNTLGGLLGLARGFPKANAPTDNFLGGLLGSLSSPSSIPGAMAISPVPIPVRRKIFFSFYFEGDIRRSTIVRQSWRFRPGHKPPTSNFYDKSLWESSKREGADSLKRLIRNGMAGSSVTCVLAGSFTWSRPWVRFEIAHSLFINNGLFGVYIHNIRDPHDGLAAQGLNPFAFLGLLMRPDGRGEVYELESGQWRPFALMRRPVPWPLWLPKATQGYVRPLADWVPMYDYVLDNGYDQLCHWAQVAAKTVGR